MRKCLDGIITILMIIMFLVVIISVIFRIFLNISASWYIEMTQICFIFLTFIGSAGCMEDESHIKISLLVNCLNKRTQRVFRTIGRIFMITFMFFFIISSYKNMLFNWTVRFITLNWMTIGYVYLVLLISGIIMIFYISKNIYYDIFSKRASFSKLDGES